MKGVLIFISGAFTGSAATLGVMALIHKKRNKNDEPDIEMSYEGWESVSVDNLDIKKEEEKSEDNKVLDEKAIEEAENYNRIASDYVTEHRESPERVLEPVFLTKEEFEDSPFQHNYYQWFTQDQVLVDDNLTVVDDNRCGLDFIEKVEEEGICWVTNDELEQVYEIERFDDASIDDLNPTDDDEY